MNPFLDIQPVPIVGPQGKISGSPYLDNARSMQIGAGNSGMRIMAGKGIWLGAKDFANAPFSVDMDGNIIASSGTFGQYIAKAGTGQTLSGDFNVGNGNVKVDGANKRILINDGTNDRILIGFQSGGF